MFVMLCNELSMATIEAKWPLYFFSVIDYWGTCSDKGMLAVIFSCNVVATCGFSSHNCVTNKVNKQAEAKIRNSKLDLGSENKKAGKGKS